MPYNIRSDILRNNVFAIERLISTPVEQCSRPSRSWPGPWSVSMSDGYITVAQCVEGLPAGCFVRELLICAFLAWFLLGALNESAALAFSFVTTEWAPTVQSAALLSASLALGNFLGVLSSGWFADKYGRLAVFKVSLLLTISAGFFLQTFHSLSQALLARFLLGFTSGGLLCVLMPLMAELLPARGRGFYLTVWCCGWPAGALFSIAVGCLMPALSWRAFYTVMLGPALLLYVCVRSEMMLESPRYLYLANRREEGYVVLLDMYDKEDMLLPWGQDSISVSVSSPPSSSRSGRESFCCLPPAKTASGGATTALLCLAMFLISAASQSARIWMLALLASDHSMIGQGLGHETHLEARPEAGGAASLPLLHVTAPALLKASSAAATATDPLMSGPGAASLLGLLHPAPLLLPKTDYGVVAALAQAYALELVGVILCAHATAWVQRRQIVQFCLPMAALSCLAALVATQGSFSAICGALMGLQLAAQACALNFLLVFACEHFPTSRRAKSTALASFAAQLGNFVMPVVGGVLAERSSSNAVVLLSCCMYLFAWALTFCLPLPASGEHSLHDVDEKISSKVSRSRPRKSATEWVTYQTL